MIIILMISYCGFWELANLKLLDGNFRGFIVWEIIAGAVLNKVRQLIATIFPSNLFRFKVLQINSFCRLCSFLRPAYAFEQHFIKSSLMKRIATIVLLLPLH